MSPNKKTAFVFAGGGSLGAIQVGMLKALLAHDIQADLVVGSSAGAINAAYFSADPSLEGIAKLEMVWRSLTRDDIFPVTPLAGLWRLLSGRSHMIPADNLARVLGEKLPIQELGSTKIPCCIVSTDMISGTEVQFRSGPAVPALLASTAIPGVFPPVLLHGHHLIDGGITSHTPCTPAADLGATTIYVLPTGYSCTMTEPPKTAPGILLHGLNLMVAHQLTSEIRRLRATCDLRVVPPLCPLSVHPYDFSQAGALIERAEEATHEWLESGVELVDGVPHQLPPHRHDGCPDPYGPSVH